MNFFMPELTTWLNHIFKLGFVLASLMPGGLRAQPTDTLTLEQAWQLARNNYPLVKQRELIKKTRDYCIENAAKGYRPQLSFSGQATYQSDVTNFPFHIPGINIPVFSKDQYKVYGQLDQSLYDGGQIRNQKQIQQANETIQEQTLEVELYALRDRVSQLFFGALLIEQQLTQNELLKKDIQTGVDKTKASVANGVAFRSGLDELQAQLLQVDQSRIELLASHNAYLEMLGLFTGRALAENTLLERPLSPRLVSDSMIGRPELLLYDYQKKTIDLKDAALDAQLRPKFSLFAQGGYGRPALNFLNNDFSFYYIGGIRMNWALGSLYTLKNEKRLSEIRRRDLDIQKETFLFNTQVSLKQQNSGILKYSSLMKTDNEIIALRESVRNAAAARLENGVITAHDYITQANAVDLAKQNLILHQVQLLHAQYDYQNITGNQ
jgi:outer membrane protein TolC